MLISKRAAAVILAALLVCMVAAQLIYQSSQKPEEAEPIDINQPLIIWYTDPDLQTYMEATAEAFAAEYWMPVETELVSEVDYIETIFRKSTEEEMAGPDLYVASSELLEKASLAGVATAIDRERLSGSWSEKSIDAVSYEGEPMGFPLSIETCFLLYNRYYAEQAPETIDDILSYADSFEADVVTSRAEHIFEWNVADVIDNYFFLGAYMELGGASGDDKSLVSIDLDKAAECMEYYQSLNAYFAVDAATVTSEEVIRDFIDGKTVFTIVNVPMLFQVDKAIENGEIPEYATEKTVIDEAGEEETVPLDFEPFYGAAQLPALTADLDTRGISVTTAMVVNPYSTEREIAESCARYFTKNRAHRLYGEAGKLPACTDLKRALSDEQQTVYAAYEQASEVPKIMELSNMWLHLEETLSAIWRGSDIQESLQDFSDLLAEQLN